MVTPCVVVVDWFFRPARWRQCWRPQSGPVGGVIAGTIVFLVFLVLLALSGCAVVYCDGATGTCGATINAMTPVQLTVPISAIPSI